MQVDGKRILDDLKKRGGDRKKTSLYLSEGLFEKFKKACGDISASVVLEELMQKFLDSLKKTKS